MGEQMQSQNRHLMTLDGDVPRELISCGTTAPLRCGLRHGWMVAILWRAYRRACPDEVRYAWSNSPESGLICDGDGVLLPPFHLPLPMVD